MDHPDLRHRFHAALYGSGVLQTRRLRDDEHPVYDPFAMATQRQGVRVLANPLSVKENRYHRILI